MSLKPIEPGCLAWANRTFLVEVVTPAPIGDFTLPNGVEAQCSRGGCWIIRSLSGPFPAAHGDALYGHAHHSYLTPISGDPDAEITETDKELTV